MKKALRLLVLYIAFLILSSIVIGLIFTTLITNQLWYEWDSFPIVDLFISPAVHTQAGAHFIAPTRIVYLVWIIFLLLTFILPAISLRFVMKNRSPKK